MAKTDHHTIIIGGGPGGASAAIYLARFNHSVQLIDASHEIPGRTHQALHLENVLGFTKVTRGPEFLADVTKQLKRFGVTAQQETVTSVVRKNGKYFVKTNKGEYTADYVVVAVGVYDIMPDIEKIDDYFGNSIFQCPTCNWYQTKDLKTGIIANDDEGITSALSFHAMKPGSCLFVVPDRPAAHFSPRMIEKAKKCGIAVYESPIVELCGKKGQLSAVVLADATLLKIEILYMKLGVKRHDTFLDSKTVGVKRNKEGYIKVNFETMETSIENLFAVGPCNTGSDQVMVAAGQGVSAALSIHHKILDDYGV